MEEELSKRSDVGKNEVIYAKLIVFPEAWTKALERIAGDGDQRICEEAFIKTLTEKLRRADGQSYLDERWLLPLVLFEFCHEIERRSTQRREKKSAARRTQANCPAVQ